MKFNKTALFLAVSAIASVSVAHLATDLTAESPTTEMISAQALDESPATPNALAIEIITPSLPVIAAMPTIVTPVAEPSSVVQTQIQAPMIAEATPYSPPALAATLNLPPPPPGNNGFVIANTIAQTSVKGSATVPQGFSDTAATSTSQSDSASTVRAEKSGVAMFSDILFSFGGYHINAEAQTMIDRIVPRLKAMDLEIILATGHADRIGSDTANDNIALKRANAVRDYLIKSGIPASKIKVESKGSSESVALNCNEKSGTRLRECLSPDRRVNVVAQGFGTAGTMDVPTNAKATTASSSRVNTSTTFTVFFEGSSIRLKSTDNDLLDEIADAALEADKVHLRGRSAIGDSEQRKARAIARGWAVRQGLVFRGVEKEDIRVFYRTKNLIATDSNEKVDVELIPRKVASSK